MLEPSSSPLPETERALRAALERNGFSDWSRVAPHLRSCVRLAFTRAEQALPIGASRMGGDPDLPAELPWPTNARRRPLSFLGQLALRELPPGPVSGLLPRRGLLSFFYHVLEAPGGYSPRHRSEFRVLYFPALRGLSRRAAPRDRRGGGRTDVFEDCSVGFAAAVSPWLDSKILEEGRQLEIYRSVADPAQPGLHQVLGHPRLVQAEMEPECELVARMGLDIGQDDGALETRLTRTREQLRQDWLLLLQLDADPAPGFDWGAPGRLYFWLHRADAKQRDFARAWAILQT